MVRMKDEPKQDITLTGNSNKQDFPARVVEDSAQEDNRTRIAAAKEADYQRQTLPAQREAAEQKTGTKTLSGGTKIAGPKDVIDRIK